MYAYSNRYDWLTRCLPQMSIALRAGGIAVAALILQYSCVAESAELSTAPPATPQDADSPRLIAVTVAPPEVPSIDPSLAADRNEISEAVILELIDNSSAKVLGVDVDNTLVALPGYKFAIQKTSLTEWEVVVESTSAMDDAGLNRLHQKPLGNIRLEGGSLRFCWNHDAAQRPDCVSQFSNSILLVELTSGKTAICIRKSAQWSAAAVDLTKSVLRANLPMSPAVPVTSLVLHVAGVQSPRPNFYPSNDLSKADDVLRAIWVREDPIQSTLDVRVVPKGNKLVLEMRSYYQDPGGARRPMVAKQMITSANKRRNLLASANNTVAEMRSAIPRLESHLSSAKSRSSDDPREQGLILRQIQAADGALTKAIRARDRAARAIPEITSGIKDMEEAIEVAKTLHKTAKVELRLVARTPDYEVPLLVCVLSKERPLSVR